MKPVLPFLETMITQVCNLSCTGCTNYSDLRHKGYVPWLQGKEDIKSWLEIVDILDFGIMGGEPLLNPQVRDWLIGVRELLPNAQIRFTTNGELLDKHWDIVDLAHKLTNVVFKISAHRSTERVEQAITQLFNQFDWQLVKEFNILRYKTSNNFRLQINRPQTFIQTYQNTYSTMKPYQSNPQESFNICIQQTCPLLYKGKIYKCSSQGLLEDLLAKLKIDNLDWAPYLGHGISTASDSELIQSFIDNFGKPHANCSMCPTSTDTKSIILHYNHVKSKQTLNSVSLNSIN